MANPEKGEVALDIDGKTYTLKWTTNAACELQRKTGKTLGETIAAIGKTSMVDLVEFVWMCLQKHHRKQFPTFEHVGDFIDAIGGLDGLQKAVEELVALNQAPKGASGGGGGRPPDAQDGTGEPSTLTLVESA